jgi:restriction system protein
MMTASLRQQMVRYATRLLAASVDGGRASQMAEDVVHDAAAYYLRRREGWSCRRFVGAVRFAALRAAEVERHLFQVRNTSAGRRSCVTNCWPVQVFGCSLSEVAIRDGGMTDDNVVEAEWGAMKERWARTLGYVALRLASRIVNAVRLFLRPAHGRRVRRSWRVLRTLRGMAATSVSFGRCLAYLRRVEPLVFEEVVLSALEVRGCLVVRNRRYSGDGGIDGRCWIAGLGWGVVQVKRYAGHVDKGDVRRFTEWVAGHRARFGLFVHTGRTGAGCYEELAGSQVVLVSGKRLVRLVAQCGEPRWWRRAGRGAAGVKQTLWG